MKYSHKIPHGQKQSKIVDWQRRQQSVQGRPGSLCCSRTQLKVLNQEIQPQSKSMLGFFLIRFIVYYFFLICSMLQTSLVKNDWITEAHKTDSKTWVGGWETRNTDTFVQQWIMSYMSYLIQLTHLNNIKINVVTVEVGKEIVSKRQRRICNIIAYCTTFPKY